MSKKSGIEAGKSNRRRRVIKGCGLLIVLVSIGLVSLDFYLKKAVPDKLEQLMFNNGRRDEVGGFEYSILNMDIELHDRSDMP